MLELLTFKFKIYQHHQILKLSVTNSLLEFDRYFKMIFCSIGCSGIFLNKVLVARPVHCQILFLIQTSPFSSRWTSTLFSLSSDIWRHEFIPCLQCLFSHPYSLSIPHFVLFLSALCSTINRLKKLESFENTFGSNSTLQKHFESSTFLSKSL